MAKSVLLESSQRGLATEPDALHPEDLFIRQAMRQLSTVPASNAQRELARVLAEEVLELALDPARSPASSDWLAEPTKVARRLGLGERDVHLLAERLLRWPGRRRCLSRRVERVLRAQLARAISRAWVHARAA